MAIAIPRCRLFPPRAAGVNAAVTSIYIACRKHQAKNCLPRLPENPGPENPFFDHLLITWRCFFSEMDFRKYNIGGKVESK
ncbi:MAG: hypothetical protein AB7F32_03485 [Victivallaceae bacterium]